MIPGLLYSWIYKTYGEDAVFKFHKALGNAGESADIEKVLNETLNQDIQEANHLDDFSNAISN